MGTRGVRTRGHSGWVAILGAGRAGGGLELDFQLEFDSVDGFEFGLGGREGILHGCLHGRARVAPLRLAQEAPGEERFVQEKDKCAAACGA